MRIKEQWNRLNNKSNTAQNIKNILHKTQTLKKHFKTLKNIFYFLYYKLIQYKNVLSLQWKTSKMKQQSGKKVKQNKIPQHKNVTDVWWSASQREEKEPETTISGTLVIKINNFSRTNWASFLTARTTRRFEFIHENNKKLLKSQQRLARSPAPRDVQQVAPQTACWTPRSRGPKTPRAFLRNVSQHPKSRAVYHKQFIINSLS